LKREYCFIIKIMPLICVLFLSSCFTLNPNGANELKSKTSNEAIGEGGEKSDQFVKAKGSVRREKILLSNSVRCITADDKNVWIGTDIGVSRLSRKESRWINYTTLDGLVSDEIKAIAIDNNWVWIGTENGVSRYNISDGKWKTYKKKDGLASDKIFSIAVDGNYVWFGTDRGLNRYDKQLYSWALRSKKDGLSTTPLLLLLLKMNMSGSGHNLIRI